MSAFLVKGSFGPTEIPLKSATKIPKMNTVTPVVSIQASPFSTLPALLADTSGPAPPPTPAMAFRKTIRPEWGPVRVM